MTYTRRQRGGCGGKRKRGAEYEDLDQNKGEGWGREGNNFKKAKRGGWLVQSQGGKEKRG